MLFRVCNIYHQSFIAHSRVLRIFVFKPPRHSVYEACKVVSWWWALDGHFVENVHFHVAVSTRSCFPEFTGGSSAVFFLHVNFEGEKKASLISVIFTWQGVYLAHNWFTHFPERTTVRIEPVHFFFLCNLVLPRCWSWLSRSFGPAPNSR